MNTPNKPPVPRPCFDHSEIFHKELLPMLEKVREFCEKNNLPIMIVAPFKADDKSFQDYCLCGGKFGAVADTYTLMQLLCTEAVPMQVKQVLINQAMRTVELAYAMGAFSLPGVPNPAAEARQEYTDPPSQDECGCEDCKEDDFPISNESLPNKGKAN